jgi:hypothetical protein
MSRFSLPALACACALTLAAPALADDAKPAKKADATERILDALAGEFSLKEGTNVADVPFFELLQELHNRHDLTFVIDDDAFAAVGRPNVREEKPRLTATQLRGLTLRQFLASSLEGLGAAYLVKNNSVLIVPVEVAAKVTKTPLTLGEGDTGRPRLGEVLVSAVVKEKPLNEAVAKIAETFDLTATVSPQAGDARTAAVSARLLNVPADKALELLALQADLRVVRRGTAYLITSKGQANEIFDEEQNKERQEIELKRLREAGAAVPPGPSRLPKP